MKRIVVLGQPGSGKSTLSSRLSRITGIEHVELDSVRYDENFEMTSRERWISDTEELVSSDSWILDGVYPASLDQRLLRADTVIVLQPGRLKCVWGWLRRGRRTRQRGGLLYHWRVGFPNVWKWESVMMPRVWAKIEAIARERRYRVHHLFGDEDIERFLVDVDRA